MRKYLLPRLSGSATTSPMPAALLALMLCGTALANAPDAGSDVGDTGAAHAVLEASEREIAEEDETVNAVLAALESGDDLSESLPEPAAGGNPIAGLSVFGWLANRFGYDTPGAIAEASASPARASPVSASASATAAAPTTASMAITLTGNPLTRQVQAQLLATRNERLLQVALEYEATLLLLEQQVLERAESGIGDGVGVYEIASWVKDAEIEVSRAQSGLLMAVDAHEDSFGYRIEGRADFPRDWQSRQEINLQAVAQHVEERQLPMARREWRLVGMEANTHALFRERLQHMDAVRRAYMDQFNIGQRALTEIVGVSRAYYDIEVQAVDAEHRLYQAQARLLGMMGRLFNGDLQTPVDAAHDAE